METPTGIPVIFTAFANPRGDLFNLNQEQNGIQDVLGALEAAGSIKHLLRTDTDLTAYFDFLQRWQDQIVIFHYGGHADSEGLDLQHAATFFQPLAEELVARNADSLQLVFLNGCSTYAHVETLFKLGVPAVIATSAPVNDGRAREFAVRFYGNIARGDSLVEAYRSAANFVKGNSREARFRQLGEVQVWRSIGKHPGAESEEFPWGLYLREAGVLPDRQVVTPGRNAGPAEIRLDQSRKKCLWLWWCFAVIMTALTLAQHSLGDGLSDIALTAWFWLVVHLYPGLLLLVWSLLSKRSRPDPMPRTTHAVVWWFSFVYLLLVLTTVLIEPRLPDGVSNEDHLLRSYFWLEPFNLLILWAYWQLFVLGKRLPDLKRRQE